MKRRRLPVSAGDPIVEVNTTPLIDVMLVLLVMLIITIPVQLHAVKLPLPVDAPPAPQAPPEVVRIDVEAGDTLRWNGSPVADATGLQQRLEAAAAQPVPPELHVRPTPDASYDRFAEVMVASSRAGLVRLGVVGSEQFFDK